MYFQKNVLFNCNLICQQLGHVLITKIPQRGTSIFYENIKQTKKHYATSMAIILERIGNYNISELDYTIKRRFNSVRWFM